MKKVVFLIIIILVIALGIGTYLFYNNLSKNNPENVLKDYFSYIENKDYENLYNLIYNENPDVNIDKDSFIEKNKNIYEGISLSSIKIETKDYEKNNSKVTIPYEVIMETVAGEIKFSNSTTLIKNSNNEFKIDWNSTMIFPALLDNYKVKVSRVESKRGSIIDRNGNALATEGDVSSIGIVPGKLGENRSESIVKIAEILNTTPESIEKSLAAKWVKDDSFVPIKKVAVTDTEIKEKLLQIPGVKISTTKDRVYPYGESASHITGYVQSITAEELEKNPDKGYNSNSVIGKKGFEKTYEDRLRGSDGVEIFIIDDASNKVSTIAQKEVKNGEDIKLTIDMNIQEKLYNELENDKGFFVVMEPTTGELLALVSTPSYDPNKFVLGMSNSEWKELSENEDNPMYTRFYQTWCPGSTFKSVTGAIGLTSGKLSENDEFPYSGLAWSNGSSWGSYEITTLTPYSGSKNLRNALIHSDNIYFARAALQIGQDEMMNGLNKIKFGENIGVLNASKSTYSNNGKIDKEILLADTGYGQGELLVNPIHMASIYSAFVNEGNMLKPYIEYKDNASAEFLVEGAFSKEAADEIKNDLIQVIENPEGTANDMKITGRTIAGKTGTAELKVAKGEEGDTLGWFDCVTVDENENQLLIISMVENAKTNGGSHYLIKKIRTLFE